MSEQTLEDLKAENLKLRAALWLAAEEVIFLNPDSEDVFSFDAAAPLEQAVPLRLSPEEIMTFNDVCRMDVNFNDVFMPAADSEPVSWDEVIELYERCAQAPRPWIGAVEWGQQRRNYGPRPRVQELIDKVYAEVQKRTTEEAKL